MSNKEIWIHGTTEKAADSIISTKIFKVGKPVHGQNLGKGVYFTNTDSTAKTYGDTLVEVEIDMELIWDLPYKDYQKLCKEVNGHWMKPITGDKLREMAEERGRLGIVQEATSVGDPNKKMVVYNQEAIKIIGKRKI